jgi:hypothetical protein
MFGVLGVFASYMGVNTLERINKFNDDFKQVEKLREKQGDAIRAHAHLFVETAESSIDRIMQQLVSNLPDLQLLKETNNYLSLTIGDSSITKLLEEIGSLQKNGGQLTEDRVILDLISALYERLDLLNRLRKAEKDIPLLEGIYAKWKYPLPSLPTNPSKRLQVMLKRSEAYQQAGLAFLMTRKFDYADDDSCIPLIREHSQRALDLITAAMDLPHPADAFRAVVYQHLGVSYLLECEQIRRGRIKEGSIGVAKLLDEAQSNFQKAILDLSDDLTSRLLPAALNNLAYVHLLRAELLVDNNGNIKTQVLPEVEKAPTCRP